MKIENIKNLRSYKILVSDLDSKKLPDETAGALLDFLNDLNFDQLDLYEDGLGCVYNIDSLIDIKYQGVKNNLNCPDVWDLGDLLNWNNQDYNFVTLNGYGRVKLITRLDLISEFQDVMDYLGAFNG